MHQNELKKTRTWVSWDTDNNACTGL